MPLACIAFILELKVTKSVSKFSTYYAHRLTDHNMKTSDLEKIPVFSVAVLRQAKAQNMLRHSRQYGLRK